MIRSIFLYTLFCFIFTAVPTHAQDDGGFTLQDALAHTYLYNPDLREARANLSAIQENLPIAQAGFKPSADAQATVQKSDVSGSNFGGVDGSTSKDFIVNLNQPLYRGGRTSSEVAAAKFVIAARVNELHALEQQVMATTLSAYEDIKRDRALLNLAQNNNDVLSEQLRAANIRFEYGDLTKTDVAQAEARLARASSDIIASKGSLKITNGRFAELTGLSIDMIEDMNIGTMVALPDNLKEAKDIALLNNPALLSAQNAYEAAEKDIRSVYGELLPEIGAFASYNRTYDPQPGLIDEQSVKTFGIAAVIPLYEAGATRARIRQAKHTHNQRFLNIKAIERSVVQDVVTNWETLMQARANIDARDAQVRATSLAEQGVLAEADFGARTVLDTLDARQEALDARTAFITANRDETTARYALAQTLGVLTPETLGFAQKEIDYGAYLDEIQTYIFKTDVDRVEK